MAYRRRASSPRRSTRRTSGNRSYSGRTARTRSSGSRRSVSSGRGQTVRIVFEQAAPSVAAAAPMIGQKAVEARKAKF